ncbi:hypothetical protein ND747_16055, partial [Frankia sp. R82]|nr:hypothetical protein [Frankia sp. R82]
MQRRQRRATVRERPAGGPVPGTRHGGHPARRARGGGRASAIRGTASVGRVAPVGRGAPVGRVPAVGGVTLVGGALPRGPVDGGKQVKVTGTADIPGFGSQQIGG